MKCLTPAIGEIVKHTWTRTPMYDEHGERYGFLARSGPPEKYIKVMRSACRCGAWCVVTMPSKRSNARPETRIVGADRALVKLPWQDGVKCGPPENE